MAHSPSRSRTKAASKAARGKATEHHSGDGSGEILCRIADALDRLAPPPRPEADFASADAFVWYPEGRRLAAVRRVNRVEMALLKGIDRVRDLLVENTERFARGLPAAIFAVGRAAGWIAHSLEQYADNRLIRPRMRYRGVPMRHWT